MIAQGKLHKVTIQVWLCVQLITFKHCLKRISYKFPNRPYLN